MLVITRRKGETFLIGDEIEISILEIQGDKIRIGVDAPKNIKILRKELVEAVREANTAAAMAQAGSEKIDIKALAKQLKE